MFSIGDFAKHGRVSVRMLRHYDAIGLLRPAHVDPYTSYRGYEASQLARLNRVIALKDLGFTLQQVRSVLDEEVSVGELRGMLRLRQAEVGAAMAADAARLAGIEARLQTIESEGTMSASEVVVKTVPGARVAELTGTAESFGPEHIGPVIGPLYEELFRRLAAAGVTPTGAAIAYYDEAPGSALEGAVTVHAAVPVGVTSAAGQPFQIVDLPGIEQAATIVHRGSMDAIVPTAQTLARWADANGYRSTGYARELYLDCEGPTDSWVTEMQEPVTRA
ncbi:MerR family transcriptional regulator [Streptomyces zagrosensis]|uniref:DNA-binding transcriptional MerR regulator n=1 Tax=Streptomyces zagrosensis TaxID=1042984 RepID=A0A7W9UWN5_9ACTN|nr:MerR family transcriptional regulator [Streptomyces zagrosensis]MBB5933978.1 DNA-binding transcriptional MerR regulator [Streptomyces zagrosensis]